MQKFNGRKLMSISEYLDLKHGHLYRKFRLIWVLPKTFTIFILFPADIFLLIFYTAPFTPCAIAAAAAWMAGNL